LSDDYDERLKQLSAKHDAEYRDWMEQMIRECLDAHQGDPTRRTFEQWADLIFEYIAQREDSNGTAAE
jgi:hypothetical protein